VETTEDDALLDPGEVIIVDEDEILEAPGALEGDELGPLADCDEEVNSDKVEELLLEEREMGGMGVELLLTEDIKLVPVMEPEVSGVCEGIELVVLLLLVAGLDVVGELDTELAGVDCIGFGVEELEEAVPELVEIPTLDDAWPEFVRELELVEVVVELI